MPIPDLFLFQLRFRNAGRQPIMKADFEEPIKIEIAGATQIIAAEKKTSLPTELSPHVTVNDTTTVVEGALLNPEDQFTIEIAGVPSPGAELSVKPPSARIMGVKKIEFQPTLVTSSSLVWEYAKGAAAGILASIVGVLVSFGFDWFVRRRKPAQMTAE